MKRLTLIILFTIIIHAAKAVDITQFYAGQRTFTSNIIVWTTKDEDDVLEYVLERNNVEIYRTQSGNWPDWVIVPYYFIDESPFMLFNFYTLKVVFADGRQEYRAAGHVFSIWWKYFY